MGKLRHYFNKVCIWAFACACVYVYYLNLIFKYLDMLPYLPPPLLKQDMTQGQFFLSGV